MADNGVRVVAALADDGFGSLGLTANDCAAAGVVVQPGFPPRRNDILASIAGVTWGACNPSRVNVVMHGQTVPFIGRECRIANKGAAGRQKDLGDVEGRSGD